MSLDSLLTVLAVPTNPAEVPTPGAWPAIESQVGQLPADYKSFMDRFGSGTIDGFVWILNPFSRNAHGNLLYRKEQILDALKELIESGEPSQYPLYPEPGGLLPFGMTDNGDTLLWQTVGEPDQWPIVVNAARDPTYEKFECNMTAFLEGILTRRIRCSIFPEDFPSARPSFVPER
jgi:hypothetical protein